MKARRVLSIFFFVSLLLLILYAVSNLLFDFHIFDISGFLSLFPCPKRLTNAEGIRVVITAAGTVCFALSYINSAKVKRVKGILMEDVITHCYPWYGVVFLFHGCFVALGMYSAVAGALRATCVCLGGILVCLGYSSCMAYGVCFSRKGGDRLVGRYIMDLIRHPFVETSRQISQALQFCQYVGAQYDAYDIHLDNPICGNKKAENAMRSIIKLLIPENGPEGLLLEAFPNIFSDTGTPPPQCPKYILFSLPKYAACCEKFQKDIQLCSVLWENILLKVRTESRQAAFVSEALLCSSNTAVLCCGLVHYLHSAHIQYCTGKESWDKCAYFLARVSNNVKKAGGGDRFGGPEKSGPFLPGYVYRISLPCAPGGGKLS